MSATIDTSDVLVAAAEFAGMAPSLHNSQPWHWYAHGDVLDLRLERRRTLAATDPSGRLAIVSCGAALHHARIHLAAVGWRPEVTPLPDDDDPYHLARVRLGARDDPDPDAARLVRAARDRHTDRRSQPGAPVDLHRVRSVRNAVRSFGAELTTLTPRQMLDLAEATELARSVLADDPAWQVELYDWVGGERPLGTGIPDSALPEDRNVLTTPPGALRRAGRQLIRESHHHAAVFAVLHTSTDEPRDWLNAGQALSAGWLTATRLDLAVLPLSLVIEVAGSRDRLRRLVDWSGHPYLVLRLATGVRQATPATPRLPTEAYVTRIEGGPR